MTKMTTLVMLACLALAAGCAEVEDSGAVYEPLAATPGGPDLPLCHWMSDELRGSEATLYPLIDNPEVVAVDLRDRIVCIDDADALLRSGVIAVDPRRKPKCTICEGTPLPAKAFNEASRRLDIHGGGL